MEQHETASRTRRPRRLRPLALGTAALATGAAALALVTVDPTAPAANADSLTRFGSCGELLDWYVQRGLADVGPYGWGGRFYPLYATPMAEAAAGSATRSNADTAQGSSSTGTNTQEADVDEPDLAKTNGSILVRVVDQRTVVILDVTGDTPRQLGRYPLPQDFYGAELLLVGDHVLVTSSGFGGYPMPLMMRAEEPAVQDMAPGAVSSEAVPPDAVAPDAVASDGSGNGTAAGTDGSAASGESGGGTEGSTDPVEPPPPATTGDVPIPDAPDVARIMPVRPGEPTTRILDLDLSDPARPRLVGDDEYSGTQLSLRQYGDVVRVITATPRPQLDWVYPSRKVSEQQALRRNRALVRASTIEDWLPSITDRTAGKDAPAQPLLGCGDVYHPRSWSGEETITVTGYRVGDAANRDSVAVTTAGQMVYSSTDRLYVASTEIPWRIAVDRPLTDGTVPGSGTDFAAGPDTFTPPTTELHAFALNGIGARYLASGHVDGTVRDRWSLDESNGRLRVAWTSTNQRGVTESAVSVLREEGDRLAVVGSATGLGRNEQIQAVRWFDDLAIVVTFRQLDPFYTVDLSNPDRPRTVGALKITGYSGYLHPIGGGRLLGVGVDATADGRVRGSQAATFDVTDLADPRRLDRLGFGSDSSMTALEDPRSFTWLPEDATAVTAVTNWRTGHNRMVAITVGADGTLSARDLVTRLDSYQPRTLPLPGHRIAIVDSGVRILSLT